MNKMSKRTRDALKTAFIGLFTNLILFGFKIVAGLISGSVSIMADAINNLGDFTSSIIVIIGFFMSQKPADKEHPFGHARSEYLSGFIVSILIIFIGVQFFVESFENLISPKPVNLSTLTIVVLIISILIKIYQAVVYYKASKRTNSGAIEASYIDSRNDALMTASILVGLFIGQIFEVNIDGILGIVIAGFVIYSGIRSILDSIDDLLGSRPDQEIKKATKLLDSYKNILGYHDLLIHTYGAQKNFATVHIEVPEKISLKDSHRIADRIEYDFNKRLSIMLVVHVDPIHKKTARDKDIIKHIDNALNEISPDFRIHDLRRTKDDKGEKVLFDLVIPQDVSLGNDEIKSKICKNLKRDYNRLIIDIVFDRNYFLD